MATNHSYLVAAKRSPVGRFLGGLSKLTAAAVGGQVAKALLDEVQANRAAIDEVLIGQVVQAGAGQNPARQVALARAQLQHEPAARLQIGRRLADNSPLNFNPSQPAIQCPARLEFSYPYRQLLPLLAGHIGRVGQYHIKKSP